MGEKRNPTECKNACIYIVGKRPLDPDVFDSDAMFQYYLANGISMLTGYREYIKHGRLRTCPTTRESLQINLARWHWLMTSCTTKLFAFEHHYKTLRKLPYIHGVLVDINEYFFCDPLNLAPYRSDIQLMLNDDTVESIDIDPLDVPKMIASRTRVDRSTTNVKVYEVMIRRFKDVYKRYGLGKACSVYLVRTKYSTDEMLPCTQPSLYHRFPILWDDSKLILNQVAYDMLIDKLDRNFLQIYKWRVGDRGVTLREIE